MEHRGLGAAHAKRTNWARLRRTLQAALLQEWHLRAHDRLGPEAFSYVRSRLSRPLDRGRVRVLLLARRGTAGLLRIRNLSIGARAAHSDSQCRRQVPGLAAVALRRGSD